MKIKKNVRQDAGFEVLTAVTIKIAIFWDVLAHNMLALLPDYMASYLKRYNISLQKIVILNDI
jgi:hypothetical protein